MYLNHRDFKDDETTSLFKSLVDKSFNTAELNNIDLINLIRGHQLNILIDLMGITSGSRLEIKEQSCPYSNFLVWLLQHNRNKRNGLYDN